MKQRILTALLIIAGVIPLFFSIEYLYLVLILVAFVSSLELNDLISDDKYPRIKFFLDYIARFRFYWKPR